MRRERSFDAFRVCAVFLGATFLGCGSETSAGALAAAAPDLYAIDSATSVDVCRLEGSTADRPGVYGTDLGFSFVAPDDGSGSRHQVLLFGDTWKSSNSVCDYPPRKSDDIQGTLPAVRPDALGRGLSISDSARSVCGLFQQSPVDPSDTSTPRPIRVFPSVAEHGDDAALYMDFNRTPLTGFSDGAHSFALFIRNELQSCDTDADCDGSFICTKDPGYTGRPLGDCSPTFDISAEPAPAPCRLDVGGKGDCGSHRTCTVAPHGFCRADQPFVVQTAGGAASPPWYDDDARNALAQTIRVASAAWPDRPEDYATGARFVTNKFMNPSVRTVKRFDAHDPEKNDYTPGSGALLLWGRSGFWGRQGFVPLLFFAYQSLDGFLDPSGDIHWAPNYFAGYGSDGTPTWSTDEVDAVPVYGAEAAIGKDGGPDSGPEFDLVNQLSLTYVPEVHRWIMFYGGDLPTWVLYDPATDSELKPVNLEPVPGAVHMRYASHPWGRATADAPASEGWSAAMPVLTREQAAPYLGCGEQSPMLAGCTPDHDPYRPLQLILAVDTFTDITANDYPAITKSCIDGDATRNATYNLSGDSTGHLYAPNILEPWTEAWTSAPHRVTVDIYFNVSTWNPYGVALMKAELVANAH